MVRTYLPVDSVGLLQTDVVDESLIAIAADTTEKFIRASYHSIKANKINMAVQTEEIIGAKEGHFETSHLGGASRR